MSLLLTGVDVQAQLESEQLRLSNPISKASVVFWESNPALVVGIREMRLPRAVPAVERMAEAGWQVAVRRSGGSAFPVTQGVLNISLMTHVPVNLDLGYQQFCEAIIAGLGPLGLPIAVGPTPGSFCDGRYNLMIDGRKIAGTSQQWRRLPGNQVRCLYHCGLLVDAVTNTLVEAVNRFYSEAGASPDSFVDAKVIANMRDFSSACTTSKAAFMLRNMVKAMNINNISRDNFQRQQ